MTKRYNLKNIRALLNQGFSEDELRDFCFLEATFRPVYDQLRETDRKREILRAILDYAERKGTFDSLLAWAKKENPAKYEMYQPYLEVGPDGTQKDVQKNFSTTAETVDDPEKQPERPVGEQSFPFSATVNQTQGESTMERQAQIWTIIGGVAAVLALIVTIVFFFIPADGSPPTPEASSFEYLVRVEAKDTGETIPNAEVAIEVGGQAPLDGFTDSKGVARISIGAAHAGRPGRLLVEGVEGYERYRQEMDLVEDALPDVIRLEPAP